MRVVDDLSSGDPREPRGHRRRAARRRRPRPRLRDRGGAGRRRRLPPRGRRGRGGVDARSAHELRPERARDADGARGGAPGRGAAARLLVVERAPGRERLPGERGEAGGAALAVRRVEGDGRGVLLGVPRRVRHGCGRGAVLERLRAALGAQGQRDPALHPPPARRRGARRLRRRQPDARLRLLRGPGGGPDRRRAHARSRRADLPARKRRRDDPRPPARAARRDVGDHATRAPRAAPAGRDPAQLLADRQGQNCSRVLAAGRAPRGARAHVGLVRSS